MPIKGAGVKQVLVSQTGVLVWGAHCQAGREGLFSADNSSVDTGTCCEDLAELRQ